MFLAIIYKKNKPPVNPSNFIFKPTDNIEGVPELLEKKAFLATDFLL